MTDITMEQHVFRYHDVMDQHSKNTARGYIQKKLLGIQTDVREVKAQEGTNLGFELDWFYKAHGKTIRRCMYAIELLRR